MMFEWISVKDALPRDDESRRDFICMTSATGESRGVIPLKYEVATIRGKTVRRWRWMGSISPLEVTHWMPLPDPPEVK